MGRLPRSPFAALVGTIAIASLAGSLTACGSPEEIPETPVIPPAPSSAEEPEPPPPSPPASASAAKPALGPWPTFERPATPPAMSPDGSVANVDTVVGGMGADLKRCYDRELAENPAAKGSVRLRVQIEPKGDVSSVQLLSQTGNLSAALLRCVAKVVGSRWFLAAGSGATLELPLTLAPDGPRKEP